MIALRVWIRQVRFGDSKDPLSDVTAAGSDIAKLFPVVKSSASDHVIDRGKCPVRMIQMTMQHALEV
ncbi:MAG TPA: hypothetical protein VHS05_16510 [Pyrinomonadaceae bacterium]|nr:hypothetical protein [Pyrinomonadaceae bacterium]